MFGVDIDFCGMKGVDGGDIGILVIVDFINVGVISVLVIF